MVVYYICDCQIAAENKEWISFEGSLQEQCERIEADIRPESTLIWKTAGNISADDADAYYIYKLSTRFSTKYLMIQDLDVMSFRPFYWDFCDTLSVLPFCRVPVSRGFE